MAHASIQIDQYKELLAGKHQQINELFADLDIPAIEIYASVPSHFRMRAEFRVWHERGELYYAMFDPEAPREPIRIDQLAIASERINALMPAILDACQQDPLLGKRLFQAEFLTTLSGEALVTLIYHAPLDDRWHNAAEALAERLGIALIGRSKGQKRVIGRDYVTERLTVDGRHYLYRQYEGAFTQPNAGVNEEMISWACRQARDCSGDLLELYCGNGNFTIPLAAVFPQVLATEISKTSVRAACENLELNSASNIRVVRMSSEEITSALKGEREFRRLADIDLTQYQLQTVFVDPPRAGLDPATRELLTGFDNILYISCNPNTLKRDITALGSAYGIQSFALFDQFPYTPHTECGVLLRKASEG